MSSTDNVDKTKVASMRTVDISITEAFYTQQELRIHKRNRDASIDRIAGICQRVLPIYLILPLSLLLQWHQSHI